MLRKVISFALTFILIFSMVIPTFATGPYVDCSVSDGSKVITSWSLNQSRTVKIYRDGLCFRTFTNTQNGSFAIEETIAGEHKYKAEAINPGNQDYKRSEEVTVIGKGKPSIRLEYINQNGSGTSVERIKNWVKIYNLGSTALDLSKLKIRYFYTVDGEPSAAANDPNNGQQKVEISDARINPNYTYNEDNQIKDVLVADSVRMSFTRIAKPVAKADYYCDTYFQSPPSNGKLYSAYSLKLQPAFNKKNLSNYECNGGSGFIRNYNPTNDYSFDSTANDWKENRNICVYYEDRLIWGNEPTIYRPEKPANLNAVAQDDMTVRLTWDTVLDAEGYIINETDKNGTTREIIVPNDNYYTTSTLISGEYTYTVSAYNAAGESAASNPAMVTVGLAAPSNLTATVKNKSVTLVWDAVNGATGYKLYKVNNGITTTVTSSSTGYTDNDVSWGKIYRYSVVALKNSYEGIKSNEIIATVSANAPKKLTASFCSNEVMLKWEQAYGAQSYKVLRSESISGPFSVLTTSAIGTTYTDTSVPAVTNNDGKKYYYKVVAVFNGIDSKDSNVADVIIYPYKEMDLGMLRSNIISKSNQKDFILGSYIPVEFELILDVATESIKLVLENIKDKSSGNEPFGVSMVKNSGNAIKVYVNSRQISGSSIMFDNNNDIKISAGENRSFAKDTSIRFVFMVKVSATNDALNSGNIENNYGRLYGLKFTLAAYKQGVDMKDVSVANYKDDTPISLNIKVMNPNKLR